MNFLIIGGNYIWIENNKNNLASKIEIYDLTGKLIHQETIKKEAKVNTEKLASGTYILTIFDVHNLLHNSKLIIK